MPARYSYIHGSRSPISITWLPEFMAGSGRVAVPQFPDGAWRPCRPCSPSPDNPSAWRSAKPGRDGRCRKARRIKCCTPTKPVPTCDLDSPSILATSRSNRRARCACGAKPKESGKRLDVWVPLSYRAVLDIEKPLIERSLHPLGHRGITGRVLRLAGHRGILAHQPQDVLKVGRADQLAVGLPRRILGKNHFRILRRHAPVAIVIARHAVVDDVPAHVLDPRAHGRVMLRDEPLVAILFPQQVRNQGDGSGPGDVVVVERPIGRAHVGHAAVGPLGVGNVGEPLLVEGGHLEQLHLSAAAGCPVAQPTLALVALGAIGGNAAVVAANSPAAVGVDAIEQLLGADEIAGLLQIVVNHAGLQGVHPRFAGIAGDFDVPETMIREPRLIHFDARRP